MSKPGRPMIQDAVRYLNGRINKAETARQQAAEKKDDGKKDAGDPSPRTARERHLFSAKCFKGGGQAQHAGDAIGQLWLVGKLDMPDVNEVRLLEACREWWKAREVVLAQGDGSGNMGIKTARYERQSRSSVSLTKVTKAERVYAHYSSFLLDASDYERDCLIDLMTPDIDGVPTPWVARIIQTEILKYTVLPVALLACDRDYAKLEAAKRAMLAMAGVDARKCAA